MLSILNSFHVPGYEHINLYHDHQDPFTFYHFKNRPKVSTDSTGKPAMSYLFIERNAQTAYETSVKTGGDEEVAYGHLVLTVDLGLEKAEQDAIEKYLKGMLSDAGSYKKTIMSLYSDVYDLYKDMTDFSSKLRLATISFTSGSSSFMLLEGLPDGTFKRASLNQTTPTLTGDCKASFYATFGPEGADLMLKALSKDYKSENGSVISTQAISHYSMKCMAHLPFDATVTAHMDSIRDYFKKLEKDYQDLESNNHTGTIAFHSAAHDALNKNNVYMRHGQLVVSEEKIKDVLTDVKNSHQFIEVKLNDNRLDGTANTDEINDMIVKSVINMVTQSIIPNLFAKTSFKVEDQDEYPDGENAKGEEAQTRKTKSPVYGEISLYKLSSDIHLEEAQDVTFSFKKNGSVTLELIADAVVDARFAGADSSSIIQRADISDPICQVLALPVSVNADFERDNLLRIEVEVDYDHVNADSGIHRKNHQQYSFTSVNDLHIFRVTMARDSEGKILESIKYRSRAIYLAKNPDGDNGGWSDFKEEACKNLIISYESLGYVNVQCAAGDIDWSVVKEAVVHLEYNAAAGKPDTKGTVRLTKDQPTGSWTCYKYNNQSSEYSYSVQFLNIDETQDSLPPVTSASNNITVNDVLSGRLSYEFDVMIDSNSVNRVKLEVLYEDAALGITQKDTQWFETSQSWKWTMRLHEGASTSFRYRTTVIYVDGQIETTDWSGPVKQGDEVPILQFKRATLDKTFKLIINAVPIDWNKWTYVYLDLTYSDPDFDYVHNELITIMADNKTTSLDIKAFSPEKKNFKYSLTFVSSAGETAMVETTEFSGPVLILANPKTE